jgi:antitoxin component YwqK of YwqJK toxin-antitoxin module
MKHIVAVFILGVFLWGCGSDESSEPIQSRTPEQVREALQKEYEQVHQTMTEEELAELEALRQQAITDETTIFTGDEDGVDFSELMQDEGVYMFPEGQPFTGKTVLKYASTGTKAQEGYFEDGLRSEMWEFWDEDGQKWAEGSYDEGRPYKRWTRWWSTGAIQEQGEFLNGRRHGTWYFWNPLGIKQSEKNYEEGIAEGSWKFWTSDGSLEIEKNYVDGKVDGVVTSYYPSGEKKEQVSYTDNVQDGMYISWYENGQKKEEGLYVDGYREGVWTFWDENGNVIAEKEYIRSEFVEDEDFQTLREGEQEQGLGNNILEGDGSNLPDGEDEGEIINPVQEVVVPIPNPDFVTPTTPTTDPGGSLPPTDYYTLPETDPVPDPVVQDPVDSTPPPEDDVLYSNLNISSGSGGTQQYTTSGQSQGSQSDCSNLYDPVCGVDSQTYVNACFAQEAGVSVRYDCACPAGVVPTSGYVCPDHVIYTDSSQVSRPALPQGEQKVFVTYYATGEKQEQGMFVNGVKEGIWQSWYPDGSKRTEYFYQSGAKEGVAFVWYDNGQLKEQGDYDRGFRDGYWYMWYDNGYKRAEGSFDEGEQVGLWRFYRMDGSLLREESY